MGADDDAALQGDAAEAGAVQAGAVQAGAVEADAATAGEPATSAISEEEVSALLEGSSALAGAPHVRPFDLTANRINRTQLPMLETVCKTFAEKMSAAISTLIGRETAVQFTALDSGKAVELQAALPVPASLCLVRLKPLNGTAFVSVEPALLLTLLDGFFGGSGRAVSDSHAAIAPAALRFLAMLLRNLAAGLTAAWSPVAPIELELVKQETNPRLMQLGAAQDVLLALRFTAEVGGQSGRIAWLIPETMLEPIRANLESDGAAAPPRPQQPWAPVLGAGLAEAQLETHAVLAEARLSLGELVRLNPGDIIPIDPPQYATLVVGGVPLFRGRFGISQGRNSLKILPGGI
jgi:flagellar motor switch protein FliM